MPNGGLVGYGEHRDIPLPEQIQHLIDEKQRLSKELEKQYEKIKELEKENDALKLVISIKGK